MTGWVKKPEFDVPITKRELDLAEEGANVLAVRLIQVEVERDRLREAVRKYVPGHRDNLANGHRYCATCGVGWFPEDGEPVGGEHADDCPVLIVGCP